MAEKLNWRMPSLKRAIQVAHSQGLIVTGYDIRRDGSLSLHTHDRAHEVTATSSEIEGEAAA